jgi:hypothetical protein
MHFQEQLLILVADLILADIVRRTYFSREPFKSLVNLQEQVRASSSSWSITTRPAGDMNCTPWSRKYR